MLTDVKEYEAFHIARICQGLMLWQCIKSDCKSNFKPNVIYINLSLFLSPRYVLCIDLLSLTCVYIYCIWTNGANIRHPQSLFDNRCSPLMTCIWGLTKHRKGNKKVHHTSDVQRTMYSRVAVISPLHSSCISERFGTDMCRYGGRINWGQRPLSPILRPTTQWMTT